MHKNKLATFLIKLFYDLKLVFKSWSECGYDNLM